MTVNSAVETKVESLRAVLPAVHQTKYFNAGTNGPLPRSAQEAFVARGTAEFEHGRIVPGIYEGNFGRNREVASLAARMFHAHPDEIALTHSTSEGMATALMGLVWHQGDEVVTTTLEHPGLLNPLALLSHRFGVKIRLVDIGNGGGDVDAAVEAALGPRTRVIALSHVQWSTGATIPLERIAAMARGRQILTIIDGAQSAGQTPIDLHGMGVDAYAMPGQKWLCGPEGSGLLYVRRDRFADIAPTLLRYGSFDISGFVLPKEGAARYEIGEFNSPVIDAQLASLRFLNDEVGQDWAYDRIQALARRCFDRLQDVPGVSLITPRERIAGLVNFMAGGMHPKDLTSKLYDRGFTIRFVDVKPCPVSARVSTGWWNTEEEVDDLVAAIGELLGETGIPPAA